MNKKILFLMVYLGILWYTFPVSAESLIFQQNTQVEISHPIRIDGNVDPSIIANITVKDPLNIAIASMVMTYQSSDQEHHATLNSGNSTKLGNYEYCISATNGSIYDTGCFPYEVTITGTKATTSQSIIFSIMGILSLLFFIMSLYGAITIPWKHPRNERGHIININDLRYIKLVLWFISYLLLIFIIFAFRHVSYIGNWDVGGNFFNGMFWLLIVFLFPTFVIVFILGFISFFDAKKLEKLIRGGFKPR